MTPKISVILPCYHVEEYLSDIIADLRAQSHQNQEIILVNDGGGSRQLELMHHLKGDDDKIIIIDKPNGGLCSARNAGMKAATGDYISFVDPDDRLEPFFLQNLLEAITSEDADIAAGGYTICYTREKYKLNDFLKDPAGMGINEKTEYLLSVPTVRNAVWNKIYRTEFIQSAQLAFDKEMTFSEDEEFNMQCLLHTNRMALIPNCGYIYMCRDANSICSKYSRRYRESRLKALSVRIQVMERMELPKEKIRQILLEDYYLLGYSLLCNIFKKNTPLSFRQKKEYINSYILNDTRIAEAVRLRDARMDNFFTRAYSICFKAKSASCIILVFGLLYGLKNRFRQAYACMAPMLKRV